MRTDYRYSSAESSFNEARSPESIANNGIMMIIDYNSKIFVVVESVNEHTSFAI